jgi:hypothetical protein
MPTSKAVCMGMLLLSALAVSTQEASGAPAPSGGFRVATSKCGIKGCRRCNRRGDRQCTRCTKGYVLNNRICDCAPGFGVCTNPASLNGRRRASPRACPSNGNAPRKLYCQRCKRNGGGGGTVTWGAGVAVCGAPLAPPRQVVNVAINAGSGGITVVSLGVAQATLDPCDPEVLRRIRDAFLAGLTATNADSPDVQPNPIRCEPTIVEGGLTVASEVVGADYSFSLIWSGTPPAAADVAAVVNSPEVCTFGGVDWCEAYTDATGFVVEVSATLPLPPASLSGPPPPPSPPRPPAPPQPATQAPA